MCFFFFFFFFTTFSPASINFTCALSDEVDGTVAVTPIPLCPLPPNDEEAKGGEEVEVEVGVGVEVEEHPAAMAHMTSPGVKVAQQVTFFKI